MNKRRVLAGAAVLWVLALFAGSMLPEWAKQDLGTSIGAGKVFSVHRLVHLVAFGLTTVLLMALTRTGKQRVVVLLFVVATGFAIEFLEDYIYHCGFEAWDVRDDTVAALLGYMFSRLKQREYASAEPSAAVND